MNESRFKCAAVKAIKKELPGCFCYHPSDKWHSGIPDLLILWEAQFAAIELKVGRNKSRRLQEVVLGRIRDAGGVTAVCRDLMEVRTVLATLKRGKP